MQQFKQSLIQALKANPSHPEMYIEMYIGILDDPDTLWDGIKENLKPDGPTIFILLGVDFIRFEGTPETNPGYHESYSEDHDLEFTLNGQKILVTLDW